MLEGIRKQIEAARFTALPAGALAKACNYTFAWEKLTWFLEYPELELSNNLAENLMHQVAIGRKNWIHIGSQQAGPKVAAILSVVESCRRLKLAVRNYVAVVLPGFTDLPIPRLPTYLRCLGSPASVVIDPVPAYPHMPNLCLFQVPDFRFSIS